MTPNGEIRAALDPKSSWDTGDEGGRVAAGRGLALTGDLDRVDAGPLELAGGGQLHVQIALMARSPSVAKSPSLAKLPRL